MKPSSRTPEGHDNRCGVCGKDLRIEPSRPSDDATCPHCGSLVWFVPDDSDSNDTSSATQQWLRAKAAFNANDWSLASRLLSMALTLDPSNTQCKTALATARENLREERRQQREAKAGP